MLLIILTISCVTACLKWGAWKRWREFYSSILYLIIGNFAYDYIFCDYTLWEYNGFLANEFFGLIIIFLIYPPVVILFLTHYPEEKWKQIIYILGWAAVGTIIEVIAFLTGGLYYEHGWNIFWSFVIFLGLFILIRFHYKRPLIVWPISLLCGIAVAFIFDLPPLH